MKTIQFILSLLATACATGMFYGAATIPSPLQTLSTTLMGILLTGCVALTYVTYKELK